MPRRWQAAAIVMAAIGFSAPILDQINRMNSLGPP
jgi:hypothetical protein